MILLALLAVAVAPCASAALSICAAWWAVRLVDRLRDGVDLLRIFLPDA